MELIVDIRKKLDDFSLDVSFISNESVTAILGASGCGKSLTLKCIAGIEVPDEGRIVLDGRVLFDSGQGINLPPQKRNVGYMFQDYALFPNMTVRGNIEIALSSSISLDGLLERFQLLEVADQYPSSLSGGQKQRVAMARMLAAKPEMILLDEPFSALDSHMRWQIENEVKQTIEEARIPTIFVSHDRDEVYRLSDCSGVMSDGTMKGIMATRALFENPETRSAAIITGCKNIAKVVRTDVRRVSVLDWGVELDTAAPVPFDEGYIGIRAHSFRAGSTSDCSSNCLIPEDYEVIEEPFEWTVSFRPVKASTRIQWKVSKEVWNHNRDAFPTMLCIRPEDIMLLKE